MKHTPPPKAPRIRKCFQERLAEKLQEIEGVELDISFDDEEGGYIDMIVGLNHICFNFDKKGENFESIGVYKDILQVVDQKQIFSTNKK